MKFEQLKLQFSKTFKELLPSVNEALSQLFGKEFIVKMKVSKETETRSLISSEVYPRVHIQFLTTGIATYRHIITLPSNFALNLYAWMISDKPEESLTSAHLEGLQEGANQLFGQLQSSLEGKNNVFNVDELKTILVESAEDALPSFQVEGDLRVNYTVSVEKEDFELHHYIWCVSSEDEKVDEELTDAAPDIETEVSGENRIDIHTAEFQSFSSSNGGDHKQSRNIEMLMDVKLEATVELGRKTMLIKDILKLGKGSVLELEKAAGEPLEIFVNSRKIADGEVVVIEDHFGIRITQLVGPKERIRNLK